MPPIATRAAITITSCTPRTLPVIQRTSCRPVSVRATDCPCSMSRESPVMMPPVASVAMKDGMRSLTWTKPLHSPTTSPTRIVTGKAPKPKPGSSSATTMLAKEAPACTERSMPPSMMTKVMPAAITKENRSVGQHNREVLRPQEAGLGYADAEKQQNEKQCRHIGADAVQSGARRQPGHARLRQVCLRHDWSPQTMCSSTATWLGLASAGASKRPVIMPSRMTRMVWQSPIVSSSVSEVRTMLTPCADRSRMRS